MMELSVDTVNPAAIFMPLNVEDYIFRGQELQGYSVYELAMVAFRKGTNTAEMERYARVVESLSTNESTRWNRRVSFQQDHSRPEGGIKMDCVQEASMCAMYQWLEQHALCTSLTNKGPNMSGGSKVRLGSRRKCLRDNCRHRRP